MKNPKNVLIIRTDRIGDVILSIPLAEQFKKHFPECKVTFLVRDYTKELLIGNQFIDEVLVLKEFNGKIDVHTNVQMIKGKKFDAAIIVYPTFELAWMIFKSRIKHRIGTGYRWYSFLFNHRIFEHRKTAERHELEYNLNLLKVFNIKPEVNKQNVSFFLHRNEESIEKIDRLINSLEINPNKPFIIVHPGSGGSSVDLPINKMRELVNLLSKLDVYIFITGAESEINLAESLSSNKNVFNLAGKLVLQDLVELIRRGKIFISNSTGPMHIAASLGLYIVAFFPKIKECSVERWGPYTNKCSIFKPELDCVNCTKEQCLRLNCMNTITIGNVFEEIVKISKSL